MYTKNLFHEILIQPALNGANKIYIVSGYATAAMAFHHLETLRSKETYISIELIVGMSPTDGISVSNHRGFQELMQNTYSGYFSCSYLTLLPPVHSKVYAWYRDNEPVCGFVGSANYTQYAFGTNQREAMDVTDPDICMEYFQELIPQTIYCNNIESEGIVNIYNERSNERVRRERESVHQQETEPSILQRDPSLAGLPSVRVSLLDKNGNLPTRSGLNWGQRPELHREPNQAYIKLPASVCNTTFFPERKVHFTVLTDDGRVLICTRAQDNGKAVHTPHNNSLIGEYFRNRLGLPNGALVTVNDLIRYGRTVIDFYKIDDETYFMDFSVPENG